MAEISIGTLRVKSGLAEMLKGGVIMDVVNAEQARIAEDAGAVAVMALERVPADIRAQGGVARMSDPDLIDAIKAEVKIPVMAKARIGHFVEAQVLEALEVDYIDESEVLSPADYVNHIDKTKFTIPFVCGATNLGEALRRVTEGAAMIRSKGEAGTGDVSEATKHIRTILSEIAALSAKSEDELFVAAKELQAPFEPRVTVPSEVWSTSVKVGVSSGSLAVTVPVIEASSSVPDAVDVARVSDGASLTPVRLIVTTAAEEVPPLSSVAL